MGKGKGSVVRYCSRTNQNHNLFEFRGFNLIDVLKLKKLFRKKLNIPIIIKNDFFQPHTTKYHQLSIENTLFLRKYYQ